MTTLKQLTWNLHKKAETTALAKSLAKNSISNQLYCDLVYTQYLVFGTIEDRISFDTAGTARMQLALDDWQDMKYSLPYHLKSIEHYVSYLRSCDNSKLMAHVYVNYMAPLNGGQIIRQVIGNRFPTRIYQFANAEQSIAEIRAKTAISMADEANLAFQMIIDYYNELYESRHLV